MPFHLQTFQSSLHPTFQPFYPLTFQPFHPLTFQPLTKKIFFSLEMSNTCKNFSRNWPGGQNFFLMVEGLRKNCGRYKNSQTKYTPLPRSGSSNLQSVLGIMTRWPGTSPVELTLPGSMISVQWLLCLCSARCCS